MSDPVFEASFTIYKDNIKYPTSKIYIGSPFQAILRSRNYFKFIKGNNSKPRVDAGWVDTFYHLAGDVFEFKCTNPDIEFLNTRKRVIFVITMEESHRAVSSYFFSSDMFDDRGFKYLKQKYILNEHLKSMNDKELNKYIKSLREETVR